MLELPWTLVLALASTGILMGLLSSLVGLRPKVENPTWWVLYAVWITVVLVVDRSAVFRTILVASAIAGVLNGTTTSLLLDRYRRSNPWHAARTQGPRARLAMQFIGMGLVIGLAFGALMGGVAWGLSRALGGDDQAAAVAGDSASTDTGTRWTLVSMRTDGAEVPLVDGSTITLSFGDEGHVTGRAGVNRYSGAFTPAARGRMSWPGALATTKMAGPPVLMKQEVAYLDALTRTEMMIVEKDGIVLEGDGGRVRLVFE